MSSQQEAHTQKRPKQRQRFTITYQLIILEDVLLGKAIKVAAVEKKEEQEEEVVR